MQTMAFQVIIFAVYEAMNIVAAKVCDHWEDRVQAPPELPENYKKQSATMSC